MKGGALSLLQHSSAEEGGDKDECSGDEEDVRGDGVRLVARLTRSCHGAPPPEAQVSFQITSTGLSVE